MLHPESLSILGSNPKSIKPYHNYCDWRPISQICLPGKLLEKIIHTQLYNYLEENKLLSDNQYGFRKGLSTGLAIFEVLKKLHDNWNNNNYSGCLFVDFSRAFDSIDHGILAEKLKLYGLDETSQKFMSGYMACRRQSTTVNGFCSPLTPIIYGTAQGSILGPLIFIVYVNKAIRRIEYCMHTENRRDKKSLSDKYKIESLRLRRKRNLVKIMYSQSTKIENLEMCDPAQGKDASR